MQIVFVVFPNRAAFGWFGSHPSDLLTLAHVKLLNEHRYALTCDKSLSLGLESARTTSGWRDIRRCFGTWFSTSVLCIVCFLLFCSRCILKFRILLLIFAWSVCCYGRGMMDLLWSVAFCILGQFTLNWHKFPFHLKIGDCSSVCKWTDDHETMEWIDKSNMDVYILCGK